MVRNIQVLRAVAALAVVWHHVQIEMSDYLGTPLLGYAGRAGVDIFFVISGFIMFHTTRDGGRTTLEFWKDRAIRIAPMYWLATLAAALLVWTNLHPAGVRASMSNVAEDMLFIPNIRLDGDTYPVLDVGWTLNYEMVFYFLFGLTFFLKSQARALAALTAIFVAGALLVHVHAPMPYAVATSLQPITLEFAAGGALALLYNRPLPASARMQKLAGYAMVIAGAAAVVWFGISAGKSVNWDYELRALVYGIPAVLIVGGALLLERNGAAATSPSLMLLGAASYAIYLVHHVIVQYGLRAMQAVMPDAPLVAMGLAGMVIMVIATAAGIAAHLYVEKPITRFLKAGLSKTRPAVAG